MAFVEPVAAAGARKVAGKKIAKKVEGKARKTVEQHIQEKRDRATKRGNAVREAVSEGRSRIGARRIKGPVSFNVRRGHNLLLAAWIVGTVVIASALWNNNEESPVQVWKRMFAYQMAMVILSWISLIESLTGWAAMFAWLVTGAVALNEKENIVQTISRFGSGISNPLTSGNLNADAGIKGPVKLSDYKKQIDSIIPRNNTAVQNANTSQTAPPENFFGTTSNA